VSTVSTRSALRSAARGDLVIPRTRRRLGNRAFSVAGPAAWNSLPPDIRTASTLSTFKNLLKTYLFFHSFQLSTWFQEAYAVWRPCNDFMDMLWRLISCRIIIIIIRGFVTMRYMNPLFTYLLTYLHVWNPPPWFAYNYTTFMGLHED